MLLDRIRRRRRDRHLRAAGMASGHGAGIYTRETPPTGAGHYLYDPDADCAIHSTRPEAFCDIADEAVAREEIHGHAENHSQLGIDPGPIRTSTDQLIDGRRDQNVARAQGQLERDMAQREGDVESAPEQAKERREQAGEHQQQGQEYVERADDERRGADELRQRHRRLDRRYRIAPSKALIAAKAAAVVAFDLGVIVAAFGLIPGSLFSKVLLAIGVSVAPLAISIGLAAWLSAANHGIRHGAAAGRYALIAAVFAGLGILLMIPFRVAVFGDSVVTPLAFSFLSVLQLALIMSETASWMVWFDAKVGRALEAQIAAREAAAERWQRLAIGQFNQARKALADAGEVERDAARSRALLRREEPLRREIAGAEEGSALLLKGVRDNAVLEGIAAGNRAAERREAEGEAAPPRRVPTGM
jgi:hypothetical protein